MIVQFFFDTALSTIITTSKYMLSRKVRSRFNAINIAFKYTTRVVVKIYARAYVCKFLLAAIENNDKIVVE